MKLSEASTILVRIFASVLSLALLLYSLATFSPPEAEANWSVWDTPDVYYNFEGYESQTNIKDRAGSNNLTLKATSGSATGIKSVGKYGRRAEFNGSTDYGEAADSATFSQTSSFSVEGWVKVDTLSSTANAEQTVLAKWDETSGSVAQSYKLVIITDSTGRAFPNFVIDSSGNGTSVYTLKGKTQIVTGEWYLLLGYFDASGTGAAYLYVNGVREASNTSIGTSIADTTAKFYLGAAESSAGAMENFLDGSIDEVRLFSGTRTEGALGYSMERGKAIVDISFDDGSGYQAISSALRTDRGPLRGALVNFPTDNSQWVTGQGNTYALQLDGTDDFVDLGEWPKLQVGGGITIAGWINPTDLASDYTVVSQPHTNGYTFKITTAGEMTFGALGGTTVTSSGANITAGSWQYVTVSYDGSNAAFYKDGRLISNPALSLWSVSDGTVLVGRAGSTPEYFKGKIDELAIYPYNRTAFEVLVDRNAGIATFGAPQSVQPNNAQVACPDGFVHVPGDPLYGTSDFCVAKYEAKCDVDGDGVGETATGSHASCNTSYDTWGNILSGCKCETDKGGNIVFSAAGHPIARIAQDDGTADDAKSYCASQGWHLITNNEWMTVARNSERLGANWYGTAPGSNFMYSGHDDETSGGGNYVALQASTDDTNGYYGTGDSTSSCDGRYNNYSAGDDTTSGRACVGQRRTLYLNNGEIVWDLSGNVWEWTDDTIACAAANCTTSEMPFDATPASEWIEFTAINTYGELSFDKIRPSDSSWSATQNVGRLYTDADAAYPSGNTHAFLRGGDWDNGAYAGPFTLNLSYAPTRTDTYSIGFRCAASL